MKREKKKTKNDSIEALALRQCFVAVRQKYEMATQMQSAEDAYSEQNVIPKPPNPRPQRRNKFNMH